MSKIKESNKFWTDFKHKLEKGDLSDKTAKELLTDFFLPGLIQIQESLNELEEKLAVHNNNKFE